MRMWEAGCIPLSKDVIFPTFTSLAINDTRRQLARPVTVEVKLTQEINLMKYFFLSLFIANSGWHVVMSNFVLAYGFVQFLISV